MCSTITYLLFVIAAVGQAPAEPQAGDAVREEQMKYLKERAAQLKLYQQSDTNLPLMLTEQPVLRYSNWAGLSSDGATFLWLSGTRPVAAVSFSLRRPNNAVY